MQNQRHAVKLFFLLCGNSLAAHWGRMRLGGRSGAVLLARDAIQHPGDMH